MLLAREIRGTSVKTYASATEVRKQSNSKWTVPDIRCPQQCSCRCRSDGMWQFVTRL